MSLCSDYDSRRENAAADILQKAVNLKRIILKLCVLMSLREDSVVEQRQAS